MKNISKMRQQDRIRRNTIAIATLLCVAGGVHAQDTTRKKEVNITSSFKPTLKEAAKINFNPTPPSADTSRPRLQYNIPNQNLAFAFQPGSLKPLALQTDSGGRWSNESYVKLGYGNFKTPFLQTGISIGDGKNLGLNFFGKHSSSKGDIDLQDYKSTSIDLAGFLKTGNNIEWTGRVGTFQDDYHKYGGMFKVPGENKDSTELSYQDWHARVGFHNINRSELGVSYSPELKLNVFSQTAGRGANERNVYFNAPVQKYFGSGFGAEVAVSGNLTRYKPDDKPGMNLNYFTFSPSLLYRKSNVNVQAGIRPSWNDGDFKLLPNVILEFNTTDKRFSVQGGWTGDLRNSGFQYSSTLNPWIWTPSLVKNTRIEERFVGIKGSAGDHFNFSVKAARNILNDQPLFINDTTTGRSFSMFYEPRVRVINIGGEIGYTVGEKFSLISNLAVNQFKTDSSSKAWGLLPLEWKTNIRVQVMKDLYVNSTVYAFDGPWSLTKTGRKNLPSGIDMSAGLEFKVWKYVKLWGQFNNIFNKEYERWNQYPVYGFNFLAGVVISLSQQNK